MELWSTEKLYTVPFNEISLSSFFVKSCNKIPKDIIYQLMLCNKFAYLCFIYIQVTLITIVMQI